ncbi:MAG: carboxypeptidase-like regulatory domain-containing protein [Myxococcales bacterium]
MNRSSIVLVAVVAGVVGLVLLVKSGTPSEAGPDAAIGTPLPRPSGAAAVPPGPGQIRGRTAPKSLVRAFPAWTAPAPEREEQSCPCDGECGLSSAACTCQALSARSDAVLRAHRSASQFLALTHAGDDGSFALAGLAAGTRVDLWAESAAGVGHLAGVAVDSQGVDVPVQPGVVLTGTVQAPSGAAGGVTVLALSADFGRFFEGSVDPSGRAAIGPVPPGSAWRVVASWADLRATDELGADETEFDVRLDSQAVVAGMVISGGAKSPGAYVRVEAARCHVEGRADADGRFSFTDFGAGGGVVVTAQAEGRSVSEGVVLGAGERKEDLVLDLGVSTSLHGTVHGPDGKPVPGAQVSYWLRRPSVSGVPGLPIARRVAPCAADGTWSVTSAAPGPYSLQATAPSFAESAVVLVEVAAGGNGQANFALEPQSLLAGRVVDPQGRPAEAVEITVRQEAAMPAAGATKKALVESVLQRRRATARSGHDGAFRVEGLGAGAYVLTAAKEGFGHKPQTVHAPDEKVELQLLTAGAVKGEVVDERGAPVTGTSVELSAPRDRRGEGAAGRGGRQSVRADATGKFRFANLAEGPWLLEATPQGDPLGAATAYATARVEVLPGAEAEVRLVLAPTLSIAGTTVDAAGRPVPEARVTLMKEGGGEITGTLRRPSFRSTTSAADGTFTVKGLGPGTWRLAATKRLHKRAEESGVRAGAQDVRVVLPGLSALRGQVFDVQGFPVTSFEANGEAFSDPEGRFAVPIRRSEMMALTVTAPGFAPGVRSFTVMEDADYDAGRIVLTKGRKVSGHVFEANTRSPIAGVRVNLGEARPSGMVLGRGRSGPAAAAVTDESGAFSMQIEEGMTRLTLDHPRYKSTFIDVVPGIYEVSAVLSRGATLRGRVLDRAGRPQRALLFASSKGGGRAIAEVGEDGTFELGGLAGGTWRVSTTSPAGADQGERITANVEVPEGGEATLDLRPKADGATLVATLKGAGAGSDSCGGMLVFVPGPGQGASVSLPPSARSVSGTLTFKAIDAGRYHLLVNCGAGKKRTQASTDVDIAGVGEQSVEVDVPMP